MSQEQCVYKMTSQLLKTSRVQNMSFCRLLTMSIQPRSIQEPGSKHGCSWIFVCNCMHVCVYMCICICICICMYIYIYACMHLYAFVYICMRLCMHLLSTKWVCTSTSTASMHFVEKQVSDTWSILKPRNTIPHQELSPDSPREQPMLQRDCCK